MADRAKSEGADLLCLPELSTTGLNWKKNKALKSRVGKDFDALAALARSHGIALCGSFLEATESGNMANTLFYFSGEGRELGRYRKIHLFSLFSEDKYVEAGRDPTVIDSSFGKIGFGICYDLRFPELFRKNTEKGAFLQILVAAFPHPRLAHWQTLVRARAIENQCFFAAVNQVGFEGGATGAGAIHYFGHSMLVDPWGKVLVEGDEEEALLTVEIDPQEVGRVRRALPAWEDRRPDCYR